MKRQPNARFWVHVNGGPVKITLRPGQKLWWSMSHLSLEPGRERVHHDFAAWSYNDEIVFYHWSAHHRFVRDRGRNRRSDKKGMMECHVNDLAARKPFEGREDCYNDNYDGVMWPAWHTISKKEIA